MGSQRNLRELGDLLQQRRFFAAGVALVVLFVALVGTFFVPRNYESQAIVRLVDNRALQAAYGRGTDDRNHRDAVVGKFREDLTGRESALAAAEGVDLERRLDGLSPTETAAERERIVDDIRAGMTVEPIEGEKAEFRFRITATAGEPDTALRVLTHLVTGYQKRQFEERNVASSGAYIKVRDELAETVAAAAAATKAREDFVTAHAEHRFGEETDTAGRLGKEKAELSKVDAALADLNARLTDVRDQLAEETEWNELEGEGEEGEREKNEVWQDLKASERALYSEIAVKKRIRKTHAARVAELSDLVRTFPELEVKWKELVQAESDLAAKRDELGVKEEKAREAWQAKAAEGALVFDVIEAPGQPVAPAGGERLLVSLMGLVLGLCGGVGSVMVMGLTDKSYRRSDEVAAALSVPVLGAIARIETPGEREESKRRSRRAAKAVIVLAVLVGATILAQLVFDEPISSFVRNVVSL